MIFLYGIASYFTYTIKLALVIMSADKVSYKSNYSSSENNNLTNNDSRNTSLNDNQDIESLDSANVGVTSSLSTMPVVANRSVAEEAEIETLGGKGFFSDLMLAVKITPETKELIVPYSKRQGLLSKFCIIQQYKDPYEYPNGVKVFLVIICAVAAFIGPFQTSLIFPALTSIEKEYKTTATKTSVSVGVYLLALGVFPIYHSSISEIHGKRNVYVISFAMLFIFCLLLCLVCHNISTFIVLRFFCGVFSSSVQSLGAGTLSDLYEPEKRGTMFGIFYLGPVLAPLLAPIVGALLCNSFDWKSTQWFMLIFSAAVMFLLILCLPETSNKFGEKQMIMTQLIKEQKRTHLENNIQPHNKNPMVDLEKQDDADENELATRILTREPSVIQYKKLPNKEKLNRDEFDDDNDFFDTLAPTLSRVRTNTQKSDPKEIQHDIETDKEKLHKISTIIDENLQSYEKTGQFIQKIEYKQFLKLYLIKPLKILYYLEHPPVALSIIFCGVSYAILYYVNLTIEKSYSNAPYNFKPLYVGLCYIPNSITYIFASVFGGRYADKRLIKYKKEHNGVIFPEARLSWNVFIAVVIFPPSLLVIGWCFDKKVFWVFPLIGTALFGLASMLIIGATTSYLTDEVKGSRGIALNNFVRQICAAAACFSADKAILAMTVGWFFTFLSFIIILSSSSLILLKAKSQYFRDHSNLEKIKTKTEQL